MVREEFGLKPCNLQRAKILTDKDKQTAQLQQCCWLLHRAAVQQWERIVFTGKKQFTQAHNGSSAILRNQPLVMVWGEIYASGKTPLVFVEQVVKINKDLESVVLPWSQQYFRNVEWTSYRMKMTHE